MSQYTGRSEEKARVMACILKSTIYNCGEEFVLSKMVSYLSNNTEVQSPTIRSYLHELCRSGRLVRLERKNTTHYRRGRGDILWERIPWRKITNAKLGIYPARLGSY